VHKAAQDWDLISTASTAQKFPLRILVLTVSSVGVLPKSANELIRVSLALDLRVVQGCVSQRRSGPGRVTGLKSARTSEVSVTTVPRRKIGKETREVFVLVIKLKNAPVDAMHPFKALAFLVRQGYGFVGARLVRTPGRQQEQQQRHQPWK